MKTNFLIIHTDKEIFLLKEDRSTFYNMFKSDKIDKFFIAKGKSYKVRFKLFNYYFLKQLKSFMVRYNDIKFIEEREVKYKI